MGTSDSRVDMYVELNRTHFNTGDYVEGTVHLNIKENCPFSGLYLELQGNENVEWEQEKKEQPPQTNKDDNRKSNNKQDKYKEEESGKTIKHSNSVESYSHSFILSKFGGNLPEGNYSYPFKFLLPQAMAGTFQSPPNYIRYFVRAYLTAEKKQKNPPECKVPISIKERGYLQETSKQTLTAGSDIDCVCCPKGTTNVEMETNTASVKPGDKVKFSCKIDSGKNLVDISGIEVAFVKKMMLVETNKKFKIIDQKVFPIQKLDASIVGGSKKEFDGDFVVPSFEDYSAIGNIAARYYYIGVKLDGKPHVFQDHFQHYLHFEGPVSNQHKQNPPSSPNKWKPIVADPIVYNNMATYVYKQFEKIPYRNFPNSGKGGANNDGLNSVDKMPTHF